MNKIVYQYVLNLLARRDYSYAELQAKMRAKQVNDNEIEEILSNCQQRGWQNDLRCATHLVEQSYRKGYGPLKIKQLLQQKGLDDFYSNLVEMGEYDWEDLAQQVWHKKFKHSTNQWDIKEKQKAYRFMLSRGFLTEHIHDYFSMSDD